MGQQVVNRCFLLAQLRRGHGLERGAALQPLPEWTIKLRQKLLDDILHALIQLRPLLDEAVGTPAVWCFHRSRNGKAFTTLFGSQPRRNERPALDLRLRDHDPQTHPADDPVPTGKMIAVRISSKWQFGYHGSIRFDLLPEGLMFRRIGTVDPAA